MSRPGRKPIDLDLLKIHATQWACLLYGLRDGYPGQLRRIEPGPVEMARMDGKEVPTRKLNLVGKATIIYPGSKEQTEVEAMLERIEGTLKREGYSYGRPVNPQPEIWRQLKEARRAGEIRAALRKMRSWAIEIRGSSFRVVIPNTKPVFMGNPSSPTDELARVTSAIKDKYPVAWYLLPCATPPTWAEQIVEAKRLWNYPRTDRPKSDDKRIEFFAKSLAALTLGKSPATATARWLSNWHWSRDWYVQESDKERIKWKAKQR